MDFENIIYNVKNNSNHDFVRISIANLISDIDNKVIGIINKKSIALGKPNIGAIGGAALLYKKEILENIGAYDFEGNDARFKINVDNLENLFNIFQKDKGEIFENNPNREIKEELSEEILTGIIDTPILNFSECNLLKTEYRDIHLEIGLGINELREFPTIYIWKYFQLLGQNEILNKILSNKAIYNLSEEEIKKGVNSRDYKIGPNLQAAGKIVYK